MPIRISGSTGISGLDGSATTPAIQGASANSGIYYSGNTVFVSTSGTNAMTIGPTGNVNFANSSVSIGGQTISSTVGLRNRLINGSFNIWQRGTSGLSFLNLYTADQWRGGTAGTGSVYRSTFTPGQTTVPGNPTYYLSFNKTNTADYAVLENRIEDVVTLSGGKAALSFWAKADASQTLQVSLTQNFGSGGSSAVGVDSTTFAVTTSWQKFTWTVNVSSISGKTIGTSNYLRLIFYPGNVLSSWTGTFDLAQVQLEEGTIATSFEQRHIGTELALCQRYYIDFKDVYSGVGMSSATLAIYRFPITLPVEMRASPTVTYYGVDAGYSAYSLGGSGNTKRINTEVSASARADFRPAISIKAEIEL